MIDYNIYKSNNEDFLAAVEEVVGAVEERNIVRLVIFIHATNNCDYINKKLICHDVVGRYRQDLVSLTSVIAQKPLDCKVVLEIHSMDDNGWVITTKERYVVAENDSLKFVFGSNLVGSIATSAYQQSEAAFERLLSILNIEGMGYSNIVRQWNYIEKILRCKDGHQHYQDFNDVRSLYYSPVEWIDGYPAATGIGMQHGGVILSFDALKIKGDQYCIKAIDNKLQRAAHVYSTEVLIGDTTQKTTPKFERAKAIFNPKELLVYISGTAAIRGEQSLEGDDIVAQTRITMENIEHLVAEETLAEHGVDRLRGESQFRVLRVYIKHEEHTAAAKAYLDEYYPNIPTFYLWGNVCREELLIEVEGVLS